MWLSIVALRLIWSRDYGVSRRVVRDVATDTALYATMARDWRETAKALFHAHGGQPVVLERHLRTHEARARLDGALAWTVRPNTRNALCELAYFAYVVRGW